MVTARKHPAELRWALHGHIVQALADEPWESAIDEVLRAVGEAEGWPAAAAFLIDGTPPELACEARWSRTPGPLADAVAARCSAAPVRQDALATRHAAWRGGHPLSISDPPDDACLLAGAALHAQGVASVVCVPVVLGGETLGMIEFCSLQRAPLAPPLLDLLGLVGREVGQAWRRQQLQRRLQQSEQRLRHLIELSSDWYWQQDEALRYTAMLGNEKGGVALEQVCGKLRWELPITLSEGAWAEHKAVLAARQPFRDFEYEFTDAEGERRLHSASGVPLFDHRGRFRGYHGLTRDITQRRQAEERIRYLASHDDLTGLPNRGMFSTVLNMAILAAQRYERKFALIFIDLDRFKLINDTLGHDAGDALLREVAARLKQCLRTSDLIARLGGDEFVVLVQETADETQAAAVARKILSAVIKPVMLQGQECRVTASVGIALFPRDAQDERTLMNHADLAMYLAKEEGKNNYQFYSEAIKPHTRERLALEAALRGALERGELFLQYQPKLDLRTRRIAGVEALLRWRHPELGLVSPVQFIPLAEETGLIVPIGHWVLQAACAQNVAWQRAGLPAVCMAVNLSPRQFSDEHLLHDIERALQQSGLASGHLEMEITEGMVMQDAQRAARVLGEIKQLGVSLAIDDFGTGYSSLAQIKRFPIDTLKIDRSFVRNLPDDTEDKAIAQAILAMARTLGLKVVAEGVETEAQEQFLHHHGCDQTQGYFFSRPVGADEFAALLARHQA